MTRILKTHLLNPESKSLSIVACGIANARTFATQIELITCKSCLARALPPTATMPVSPAPVRCEGPLAPMNDSFFLIEKRAGYPSDYFCIGCQDGTLALSNQALCQACITSDLMMENLPDAPGTLRRAVGNWCSDSVPELKSFFGSLALVVGFCLSAGTMALFIISVAVLLGMPYSL